MALPCAMRRNTDLADLGVLIVDGKPHAVVIVHTVSDITGIIHVGVIESDARRLTIW
jgi:hypothetical protein